MPELASAKKAISNQYTNSNLIVEGEKPEIKWTTDIRLSQTMTDVNDPAGSNTVGMKGP